MLGRHHSVVYLFLVTLFVSGLITMNTAVFASGPTTLQESSVINGDLYIVTIPVVLGSYAEGSVATFDLSIERIEVTQAVQDVANSVPLVSGRQTVVRVYIRTDAPISVEGIRVSLAGMSDGQALPNSPLVSGPGTVLEASDRGVYASTFNFILPASWLDEFQIALTARVDVANLIAETNESNNTLTEGFTLTEVPPLDLVIVPIRYTHTPTGVTYGAPNDTISSIIYRLYPVPAVDASLHQALAFSGNLTLSAEWGRLLELVDALKTLDNAPDSRVYYGLIPSMWFNGGYAGLGYVGWRTSIGLQLEDSSKWLQDQGAFTAAHEIGHNLNSLHAPGCGAGNVDPAWPWLDDGHTHEYGLDLGILVVKLPTAEDVMGYCRDGGMWISSYTYRKFLADQRANGGASISQQPQEMLFIRAILDDVDNAILQPIYHLIASASAAPISSDYSVQLWDANGQELARYLVEVKIAQGNDFTVKSISALVPLPAGEPVELRLLKGNTVLAQRQLQSAASLQSSLQLASAENGLRLTWSSGGQPALVRYTTDGGLTWSTLAFDLAADELTIDPTGLPSGGYFEVSFADTALPVRLVNAAK